MTGEQRRQRAAFVREQPGLWLFLLYAGAFLGCSVAIDLLQRLEPTTSSSFMRYLLPVAIALAMWLLLYRWARQVLRETQRTDTPITS